MRLNRFLHSLWESGRVQVDRELEISDKELRDCLPLLQNYEKNARLDHPEGLPAFDEETSLKSLSLLYHICQLAANRDFSENLVSEVFSTVRFDEPHTPESAWSADIIFQHLPGVLKIASRLSKDDILCRKIKELAAIFPLSSVGIVTENIIDDFLFSCEPLKIIYLNRIIERQAEDRLNDRIVNAAEEKLGGHKGLCGMLDRFKREQTV